MHHLAILAAALLASTQILNAQAPAARAVSKEQLDALGRELRDRLDEVRANEREIGRLRREERTLLTAEAAERQLYENQAALYREAIEAAPEAWKATTGGRPLDVMIAGEKVRQLAVDALSVNDPAFDLLDADERRREIGQLIDELRKKNAELDAFVIQSLVDVLVAAAAADNAVQRAGSVATQIQFTLVDMGSRATEVAASKKAAREETERSRASQRSAPREGRDRDPPGTRDREPRERTPVDRAPKEREPTDRSPKDRAPREQAPREREPRERAPKDRAPKDRAPKEGGPEIRRPS